MKRTSPLALALDLFQLQAEEMAGRFGVTDVTTHCSNGPHGFSFHCCYHLSGYGEALEAPAATSPRDAVLNLEDALRQMSTEFFSTN
jgi:hypothetical protein